MEDCEQAEMEWSQLRQIRFAIDPNLSSECNVFILVGQVPL